MRVNAVVHGKCDRCHQFVKWRTTGRLTADQKVKVVLFYAETKSVVATQRSFRAHFGTRWAPCKQTIYRRSLGTIFQSMRINSVPDVKWFCNNKNVLCVQSVVWQFVRHLVYPVKTRRNCLNLLFFLLISQEFIRFNILALFLYLSKYTYNSH